MERRLNSTYVSFENNPDELIFQLEKYIELSILSRYTSTYKTSFHITKIGLYCNCLSDKLVVERYLEFVSAIRLTMRLNGGHRFIFDILLGAKNVFDWMEKNKNKI